ncbi:hypothetical protein D3C77_456070 [compost metagenome]
MPVNNTAGLPTFIKHRQGVEVGLAAEQFQYLRRGCVLRDCRLLVEQGGQIAAVLTECLYFPDRAAKHVLDIP